MCVDCDWFPAYKLLWNVCVEYNIPMRVEVLYNIISEIPRFPNMFKSQERCIVNQFSLMPVADVHIIVDIHKVHLRPFLLILFMKFKENISTHYLKHLHSSAICLCNWVTYLYLGHGVRMLTILQTVFRT